MIRPIALFAALVLSAACASESAEGEENQYAGLWVIVQIQTTAGNIDFPNTVVAEDGSFGTGVSVHQLTGSIEPSGDFLAEYYRTDSPQNVVNFVGTCASLYYCAATTTSGGGLGFQMQR